MSALASNRSRQLAPNGVSWVYLGDPSSVTAATVPLVVLPGFPSGIDGIGRLLEGLARTRVVVALDPLGYGRSRVKDPMAEHFAWPAQAQRIAEVLDALGLRNFALLGLSMGGIVAQYLLALAGARVQRTVLVGTCARLRARERAWVKLVLAQLDSDLSLPDICRGMALSQFRPDFLYQPAAMMIVDHFARQTDVQRAAFVELFRALLVHDQRQMLARWPGRVVAVVGELDSVFPPALAQELLSLCEGAELVAMQALGHAVWVEDPLGLERIVDAALK